MSKFKNIIKNIKSNIEINDVASFVDNKVVEYIYKKIKDEDRTESEKIHNKWRNRQKKEVYVMEHPIRAAKKEIFKPGLQFEAPLKILAEKYKDIETIFKHMSLGQLSRYIEKADGFLYEIKTNKRVYDIKNKIFISD